VIGGAAVSRSMIETFQQRHKVEVVHAWGMTEMSPIGTVGTLTAAAAALPESERLAMQCKQGHAPFGVEIRIVDEAGAELARDGRAAGHLLVRGPWVASAYFNDEGGLPLDAESWFDTGDIATIDAGGYMQIVDRSKDVIKSGGEWISSIELENAAAGCPGVAEAAVIGVADSKWGERPLLIVVPRQGGSVTRETVAAHLAGRVAKWWLPERIEFVDALPHNATGKIDKRALRQRFAERGDEPPSDVAKRQIRGAERAVGAPSLG
jgi:acyl-CoA synthetase (AMP-forming)/AMP-acid ligase II